MPRNRTDMPASFRASLDAALARPLLLEPRALDSVLAAGGFRPRAEMDEDGEDSAPEAPPVPYVRDGDVAVVSIEGPLAQRAWACWMFSGDGYDAIVSRVNAALADASTRAVVLRLDSPGGEVAGCFEAVRSIRAASAAAGKPLVAYCDEMAASAAYALACACDEIVCPDTGILGSIGVIFSVTEQSEALRIAGRSTAVITSGAAKADGHPALPLSKEARARYQAEVDQLADVFAGEVSAARGLSVAQVRGLEARVFLGASAVNAGLADRVGNVATALERARALAGARTPVSSLAREPAAPRAPTTAGKTPARGAHMQSILALLGLPETATEHDAASAVAKATDAQRQILALTGSPSFDAAFGTLLGWKAEAGKSAALAAQLAERDAAQAARERSSVLDALVTDTRMTPAERAEYDSDPALAALPLAAIQAMARTRTASSTPLVKTAPVAPVGGPPAASLDEETLHIAAAMGLDRAKLAAHLAAEVK